MILEKENLVEAHRKCLLLVGVGSPTSSGMSYLFNLNIDDTFLARAEQELKRASSILNITSTGLNLEELNKAKTIANSCRIRIYSF